MRQLRFGLQPRRIRPPLIERVFLLGNCPFGILDMERPCPSTTYFEKIGLTRSCS